MTDEVWRRAEGCKDLQQALLERYAELHPDFWRVMDEEGMREGFRRAYVLDAVNRFDFASHCIYRDLIEYWSEFAFNVGEGTERLCVLFSDRDTRATSVKVMAEVTEYAMAGSTSSTTSLLQLAIDYEARGKPTAVEDSVRFYLQLRLEDIIADAMAEGNTSGFPVDFYRPLIVGDMRDRLTIDHAHFVEAAYRRGDYMAVIDAVPRC